MKTKKQSFTKRIFVFFCCTVLLSSSIFASYSTTLYAADDYDLLDGLQDICLIVLGVAGVLCPPAELTALGFVAILSGALGAVDGAINIYDHVTDNGDGTYTIDSALVQAAMDAAEQLEAQGFTDSDVKRQGEGYLQTYKWTVSNTYMYAEPYQSKHSSHHDTYIRSCEVQGRVAGFNSVYTGTSSGRNYTAYEHTVYNKSLNIVRAGGQGIFVTDGNVVKSNISGSSGDGILVFDGTQKSDIYSASSSFGGNFPIFSTYEACSNYLSTGKGYKDAENYRPAPLFRRHSSYMPTYTGGSITVNRTVVQNIASKIAEVDADDTKTDDEKIEILQKYILSGGSSDTGGDSGGGDKDYDDNKDLPAGTDLADTNSWLKKIYLKVCQIFDKMTSSAGKTLDDVVIAIEDLSQMLKRYLAEITGDLDDIKGQLEDMSEQEFNDKTDSFLSQLMDLFSEISETAKGKFPFSIPSDIQFLIARISGVSPETAASYSYDENTVSSLSFGSDISLNSVAENDGTDHGGGGSSRPGDETEPPGGGGASRPGGSGFVSVEHGGGGSEREPVSSNNWAPVFTLPIVIERYGIEEYIILDMSMFDSVSKMSRTLFLIMYIVCLYNMTFKVMGLWGDLVG